jgi:hypothetical protein
MNKIKIKKRKLKNEEQSTSKKWCWGVGMVFEENTMQVCELGATLCC